MRILENNERQIISPVQEILRLSHCVGAVKVKSKARAPSGHRAKVNMRHAKARVKEDESMANEEGGNGEVLWTTSRTTPTG